MLHEISRESIPVTTNEEPGSLWQNSILAVRANKGIQLFDFAFDIQSYEKKLNWNVSLINAPKTSPVTDLLPKSHCKNDVKNIEFTQMLLDPGLWPHNPQIVTEMTSVSHFEWSQPGTIHNNESVLAVLNNLGGVEFFARKRTGWTSKHNLSDTIKKSILPADYEPPKRFEELLQVIKSLETSAICWGPKLEDGSSYFVTAMRDSKVLIWKIRFHIETQAEIVCETATEFGEVVSMLWIPRANNSFSLICSNSLGQIFCLEISSETQMKVTKCTTLWAHKDRMVAKCLRHTSFGDKLVLFTNKHRYLVVQLIDSNSNITSQVVKNINDHRITNITYKTNAFYLTTVNGKLYKIDFKICQDKITVDFKMIETKESYPTHEFYSVSASTNGVIWVLVMADKKIKHRKSPETLDIVFLVPDLLFHSELNLLLDNPSNCLNSFWDCIELIRCKVMKQKKLPQIDYNKLYKEGICDQYKMRLYLVFLKLYNNLERIMRNGSKGVLPETSLEVVQDQIFMANAVTMLTELFEACHGKTKLLSDMQGESFAGATRFLEYFCHKYRRQISDLIKPSVNFINVSLEYCCQGCDGVLRGYSCENGHVNSFCSKTFTLIDCDDYLTCKSCGNIARIELLENSPMCVLCDLHLNNDRQVSM